MSYTFVALDPNLHKKLKLYCKSDRRYMSGVLDKLVADFLERPDVKKVLDEATEFNKDEVVDKDKKGQFYSSVNRKK